MRAVTIEPMKPGTARLEDIPEPEERDGSVLEEAVAVGVCGTDVETIKTWVGTVIMGPKGSLSLLGMYG